MLQCETPKSFGKYATLYSDFSESCYSNVCLMPRICTKNNSLKDLQYQIIHRYLPTNRLLYKMGKIESMRCTLCRMHTETISHIFYECTLVTGLWLFIERLVSAVAGKVIKLNCQDVILGYQFKASNVNINNVILYTKNYIWHVRKYQIHISVENFCIWLRDQSLYDNSLEVVCKEFPIS